MNVITINHLSLYETHSGKFFKFVCLLPTQNVLSLGFIACTVRVVSVLVNYACQLSGSCFLISKLCSGEILIGFHESSEVMNP